VATVLVDLSILATETRVRGIGRYLVELATALERAARDSPRIELRFLERVAWTGSHAVADDASQVIERLLAAPPVASLRWAWHERLGIDRALGRARPALLHQGSPYPTPLRRPACPRVVTCHDLIPLAFPAHYRSWRSGGARGRRWLDRRRFGSATHLIAISRATADDLMRILGIPAERISVVHNGIDLRVWSPVTEPGDAAVRERLGLDRTPYLVYAGDADWRKNRDGMLAALAHARRRAPSDDLRLAWAGVLAADRRAALLEKARALGVEQAIVLTGWLPDDELRGLYRGARGVLFVSRAEGFGYPVLEGMACGTPVVTSNRSSMAEIAERAALLVDPEDPAAIGEALVRLGESERLRRELGEAGLERAARYTLGRQAKETLAVYESVLAGRRP
jgi:glycosyltransferase involved in cell wall biosynthesis